MASSFAKRTPLTVTLEVARGEGASLTTAQQTQGDEAELLGLVEIEKSVAPFLPRERSEHALETTQSIEIGLRYPAYAIYVTTTRPLTLHVTARANVQRWILLAGAVVVVAACILAAAV